MKTAKGFSLSINKGIYHVSFRIRDKNGKLKQKCLSTGFKAIAGNQRKAEAKAREIYFEYRKKSDAGIIDSNILLCDYIKDFVERRKIIVAPTTYDNDQHYLNKYIYPYFKKANLKLKDIKPRHIEQYWSDVMAGGLSANSALKHIRLISPALKDAVKNGYIPNNPCELAAKPKKTKAQHIIYNADELVHLLEVSKGTSIELPIYLAANFALRREEALGLRWSDIDFDNKIMHIRNTATRGKKDGKLTTILAERTKTESSTADYELNDEVCEYLKAVKAYQEQIPRITQEYANYVCVNQVGELLKPDYVSRTFGNLLKKNQMKKITFHELRHSCLSLLVQNGIPMKVVQEYARHSNYSTTADIYSHLDKSAKLQALDLIRNKLDNVAS